MSALKCLKIEQMYYFCNDYIITDGGIRMRDEYVRPLPEDFFYDSWKKRVAGELICSGWHEW